MAAMVPHHHDAAVGGEGVGAEGESDGGGGDEVGGEGGAQHQPEGHGERRAQVQELVGGRTHGQGGEAGRHGGHVEEDGGQGGPGEHHGHQENGHHGAVGQQGLVLGAEGGGVGQGPDGVRGVGERCHGPQERQQAASAVQPRGGGANQGIRPNKKR